MPNLDGTGPKGRGPRTGRGLGNCKSAKSVKRPGRGLGRGQGRKNRGA